MFEATGHGYGKPTSQTLMEERGFNVCQTVVALGLRGCRNKDHVLAHTILDGPILAHIRL